MGKVKPLKDNLHSAAVVKMRFRLLGDEDSPVCKVVYPGVLRSLHLEDAAVEKYITDNREVVERAARGDLPVQGPRG